MRCKLACMSIFGIHRDKSKIIVQIEHFKTHKNIFTEGELVRNSVVANFTTTATDGKEYQVARFSLQFHHLVI